MSGANAPVLVFHHIPKTAGTAFRTALFNLFGEANCTHLRELDLTTTRQAERAVARGSRPRMVCGHLPVRYVASHLRDTAVTFLREPVNRVLSLFRFILTRPLETRRSYGLGDNFSLREFLSCPHPDVANQVNNAMCRFLAREHSYWPIDNPTRKRTPPSTQALRSALQTLDEIDFGIVEQMEDSLALLTAAWGLPFPLRTFTENASPQLTRDVSVEDLAEIASRNTLDAVLYRLAREKFEVRLLASAKRKSSIAQPITLLPDREYCVDELPLREGFHAFEDRPSLSWMEEGCVARLHFRADDSSAKGLSFRLYAGQRGYPVETVTFTANGDRAPAKWYEDQDGWGTAFIGPFQTQPGLNTLEIKTNVLNRPPVGGLDKRRLSIALSTLRTHTATA